MTASLVSVAEEATPQYTLTFSVVVQPQLPGHQSMNIAVRKVTKQHMANAFERAVGSATSDFAQLRTQQQVGLSNKREIDDAVQQWLLRGKAAPTREEIVLWLLSRMVLVPSDCEKEEEPQVWSLLICGEQGVELAVATKKGPQVHGYLDDHDEKEEELPTYDERPVAAVRANESDDDGEASDMSSGDEFEAMINGDEHVAPEPQDPLEQHKPSNTSSITRHHAWPDANFNAVQKNQSNSLLSASTPTTASSKNLESDKVERSSVHLQATLSSKELVAPEPQPSTHGGQQSISRFTFEPTSTRLRRHSSSKSASSSFDPDLTNEWTQDRKSFQLELHKSRKDIQAVQELQRKTETIAHLRQRQLFMQSQRKLRAHDQKRDDAHKVSQLVADTLEYHELLNSLETQVKRTKISAKREQERVAQTMRVALGRSEKHIKGPILGSGPLSQIKIDAMVDKGGHEVDTFVYDLHGRRHSAEDAQSILALGVFESAMLKIKRILERSGTESVLQLFRKFDTNRSGTLSREEFRNVLLANDVKLTGEQASVFFQHFDPNRSGEVDYGELLWGFFNRRAFLKKWQHKKTRLSPREIKLLFYQYDRTGRGALSARDFQLAMDDIGFQLTEHELKLLVLKFDANHDGFIDYHEFHAFVSNVDEDVGEAGAEDSRVGTGGQLSQAQQERRTSRSGSVQSQRQSGGRDGEDDDEESVERILNELRALSETQTKIRQSIRK